MLFSLSNSAEEVIITNCFCGFDRKFAPLIRSSKIALIYIFDPAMMKNSSFLLSINDAIDLHLE
ncbi:hypothetical protein D3C84_719790 [compost metagenome]